MTGTKSNVRIAFTFSSGAAATLSGMLALPPHDPKRRPGLNVGSPAHFRRSAGTLRRSAHDPTRTNGGIRFSASAGIYPHALRVSTASGSRHCPGDPRSALEPGKCPTAELTLWRHSRHCAKGILLPRRATDLSDHLLGRLFACLGFLSHLYSLAVTMS